MAKFLIEHDDAINMHKDFYDAEFEVVQVNRSGAYDRFPWSLFYGVSDIGSWSGLISTDGNKVVITEAGAFKDGKITNKWEFPVSQIKSINHGTFKTKFNFDEKIKGLTTKSFFEGFFLLCFFVLPFFFYNSKKVNFRIKNNFKNKDEFIKKLGK